MTLVAHPARRRSLIYAGIRSQCAKPIAMRLTYLLYPLCSSYALSAVEALRPDKETRLAKKPFVAGQIFYTDGCDAALFYNQTTLFPEPPQDVAGYAREHEEFGDSDLISSEWSS